MKHLRSNWRTLEKRLRRFKKKILFLDFDGTLATIAKTPEAVRLDPATYGVLKKLSRKRSFRLVIVSGRSLTDLKRFFHLPRVLLIGNHGLEARPARWALSKDARRARRHSRAIRVLAAKLRLLFKEWPGVHVEDKTYTLSLHFRNLTKDRQVLLHEIVRFYRARLQKQPLVWKTGKKVWEVRPAGYKGKADVITHLIRRSAGSFPIVIGDDASDEEMFEALCGKGLAVRVGRSSRSAASRYARSPREVRDFLEDLCRF